VECGIPTEVLLMQAVKDLAAYRAVVVGSAIRGAAWLPEATDFIQTHRAALTQKPCALFTVCMTLAMANGELYRQGVQAWVQPARCQLRPVSEGLFAGGLDIRKVPSFGDKLKFRLSVMFGVWKEGDHRDWKAIHTWAESLVPLLLK